MARFSRFRRRFPRPRVIVQRMRSRRAPASFAKKNKTVLMVLALAAGAYFFKDKIKELVAKKG